MGNVNEYAPLHAACKDCVGRALEVSLGLRPENPTCGAYMNGNARTVVVGCAPHTEARRAYIEGPLNVKHVAWGE